MSDHIPDLTKMISDTPRTDAKRSGDKHFMGDWVNANFACQLERELNAATSEIARLTSKVAQLYEGAEEQNQRIKRMEQGGDEAFYIANQYQRLEAWHKAKEAKP
jgi:hypothetical protein